MDSAGLFGSPEIEPDKSHAPATDKDSIAVDGGEVYTAIGLQISGNRTPEGGVMLMSTLRLVAVIMGTAAIAWAADPLVGTWILNVSKSKFTPGPAPQEETRVYEAQAEGINVTVKTIEADGHTATMHISANYDGKDYPVTGSSDYDVIKLTKINDRVAEATLMHGSRLVATAKREVSPDGKTMTITYKTPQDQGHPIDNQAVYEKQ